MSRILIGFMLGMLSLTLGSFAIVPTHAMSTGAQGQPGAFNGLTCGSPSATATPGNSVNAPGAPFNPSGQAGLVYAGNPGTASLAHANSPHSVSEYDIACFQVTTKP